MNVYDIQTFYFYVNTCLKYYFQSPLDPFAETIFWGQLSNLYWMANSASKGFIHQNASNDTIQPVCKFQVDNPFTRASIKGRNLAFTMDGYWLILVYPDPE